MKSSTNLISFIRFFFAFSLRMWHSKSPDTYAWRHRFASIWIPMVGTNHCPRPPADWSNPFKWSLRHHSGNHIDWVTLIRNFVWLSPYFIHHKRREIVSFSVKIFTVRHQSSVGYLRQLLSRCNINNIECIKHHHASRIPVDFATKWYCIGSYEHHRSISSSNITDLLANTRFSVKYNFSLSQFWINCIHSVADMSYERQVATIASWIEGLSSDSYPLTSCQPRKVELPVMRTEACTGFLIESQGCVGVVGARSTLCEVKSAIEFQFS